MIELTRSHSKSRLVYITLGMGLDAKHMRRIIHYKPPTSLDRHIQETEQAGKDGKPAKAILYYNATELRKNQPALILQLLNITKIVNECVLEQ